MPERIWQSIAPPETSLFSQILQPGIMLTAIALAFIASTESLLSASAVDRMQDRVRTQYDRELFAQGIGNGVSGLLGGLPITGVIVRSSANVTGRRGQSTFGHPARAADPGVHHFGPGCIPACADRSTGRCTGGDRLAPSQPAPCEGASA